MATNTNRLSLTDSLASQFSKLTRTFTNTNPYGHGAPRSPTDADARSRSRGREVYVSSGRGGAGNMRRSSASRDARPVDGPDDFSSSRGRELPQAHTVTHSGRGGAGNIRSPSRNPAAEQASIAEEKEIILKGLENESTLPHSTGRGGIGNISRSRSRAREDGPVHSTGKGGFGNIVSGAGTALDEADEAERKAAHAAGPGEGIHTTGRGGFANLTSKPTPPVEDVPLRGHHEGEPHVVGRGGAGNILHSVLHLGKDKKSGE